MYSQLHNVATPLESNLFMVGTQLMKLTVHYILNRKHYEYVPELLIILIFTST